MQFFTDAYAETTNEIEVGTGTTQQASQPEFTSSLMNFIPLIIIFVIFYLLIIRPQQKKVKAHEKMLSSIKRGDKVKTVGGLIGVIMKVDNKALILTIEIAENVEVKVSKSSIAEILTRTRDEKD